MTCQRQQSALYQRETEKLQKKDKRSLSSDGKAHVVTNDDFIAALNEIEERDKERDKEREEDKERRKLARVEVKKSKDAGRKCGRKRFKSGKRRGRNGRKNVTDC